MSPMVSTSTLLPSNFTKVLKPFARLQLLSSQDELQGVVIHPDVPQLLPVGDFRVADDVEFLPGRREFGCRGQNILGEIAAFAPLL